MLKRLFAAKFLLLAVVISAQAQEYASGTGTAEQANAKGTLTDATRRAVISNPEVLSNFHAFQAAEQETRVARGGYFPRLDLEGGVGRERIDDPRFPVNDFSRDRVSLSLSQMLFDGFATRNEVRRLNHAARTRYYEVWSASENVAAEAARAYLDVLRHRDLVNLSEENYAQHRLIYEQIERRTQAGISRRVDLEQAAGRLALSESNLLTDVTNLYDVSTRYQRIVGELPPEQLDEPSFTTSGLPPTVEDALRLGYTVNPLMNAAIANVWSAQASADVVKATMMPRFDVRARQDVWHDKDDIDGRLEEGVVELVMTYNLFNGGSDTALRKQRLLQLNVAQDLRDRTCRDIRQELSIAYNNTRRLEEQKIYLDRHQLAIAKAREAYRRQFDIGQRTLLDLLDTENEYYEARRAYIDALRDHAISYARTLASMGKLIATLSLGNQLHSMELPTSYEEIIPDVDSICPPERAIVPAIDKEQVFRKAMSKAGVAEPLSGKASTEPGATQPVYVQP